MKNIFSYIICILLIQNYLQSQSIISNTTDFNKNSKLTNFNSQTEKVERRTEFTKYFANADGTNTAIISAESIHYLDEQGLWQDINLEITPNSSSHHTSYSYTNATHVFKTYYADNHQQGILTEYQNHILLEGLNKEIVFFDAYGKSIGSKKALQNTKKPKVNHHIINYSSIFKGIDLQYIQSKNQLKMNYLLQTETAISDTPSDAVYMGFAEDIKLPEDWILMYPQSENTLLKHIIIYDTLQHKKIAEYTNPTHQDAKGKQISTYYKIHNNTIYTMVPVSWLTDTATVYPVTIDPTKTISPSYTPAIDGRKPSGGSLYYISFTSYYGVYMCNDHSANVLCGESFDYNSWSGSLGTVSSLLSYNTSSLGLNACSEITSLALDFDNTTFQVYDFMFGSHGSEVVSAYSALNLNSSNLYNNISYQSLPLYKSVTTKQLESIDLVLGAQALADLLANPSLFRVVIRSTGSAWGGWTSASGYDCYFPAGECITGLPKLVVTYSESQPPKITASPTESCPGEEVTLKAESPDCEMTSCQWREGSSSGTIVGNTAETKVNPTTTTTYYALAGYASGSTSTQSITISMKPSVKITTDENVCEGNTYTFRGEVLTTTGQYTDTVPSSDAGSCDTIFICNFTVHSKSNVNIQNSVCQGEEYDFFGTKLTTAGSYTHTLQSVYGCDSTINLTLTINPIYETSFVKHICEGDNYNFFGQFLSATGTYKDTVTSVNNCDSIVTVQLYVDKPDTTRFTATICLNNSYTEHGFNIPVQNTEGSFAFSQSLKNQYQCDSIVELRLTVSDAYLVDENITRCSNELPYTHEGIEFTETGVKTINLVSQNGCDSIVTIYFTVQQVQQTIIYDTICQGDRYTLNGFDVNTSGIHTLNLKTEQTHCDSTVTLYLTVNNPIVNLGSNILNCDPTKITTLNAGSDFDSYLWNDGSQTQSINVSQSGTYSVIVTQGKCSTHASIEVTYKDYAIIMPISDTTICQGTSVTLTAPEAKSYLWSNNATSQSIEVRQAGIYRVTVTNDDNCQATASTQVHIENIDAVSIQASALDFCDATEITLTSNYQGNAYTYQWSGGTNAQTDKIQITSAGTYYLAVTQGNCTVNNSIEIQNCDCELWASNAFSPNNDGKNDTWTMAHNPSVITMEIYIYDRWGSKVFYSNSLDFKWDGTLKGKRLPIGVYTYVITYICQEALDRQHLKTGIVTLIR